MNPNMNQESLRSPMLRVGAILAAAGSLVAACSDDKKVDTTTTISSENPNSSPTTVLSASGEELVFNLLNPTAEELQDFNCIADGKESNGYVEIVNVQGKELVAQVLPGQMGVAIELTDDLHRKWSNSISSPFIGDLSDKEALEQQVKLTFCEQPVELGTFVDDIMNGGTINGLPVSQSDKLPDYLKQFVGLDVNQIIAKLANPYNASSITLEQETANVAATENRQMIAEWAAAVLNQMQNDGVQENVTLRGGYELLIDSAVDPLALPLVGRRPDYNGDRLTFTWTEKEDIDCTDVEFGIGFNAGDGTEEGKGGDKSPVDFTLDINCDEPEVPTETTVVPGTTTPKSGTRVEASVPVSSVVIQGPGVPGTPDTDDNADNNVTTSNNPTTTQGGTTTTTIKATSVTSTTLGECGALCD